MGHILPQTLSTHSRQKNHRSRGKKRITSTVSYRFTSVIVIFATVLILLTISCEVVHASTSVSEQQQIQSPKLAFLPRRDADNSSNDSILDTSSTFLGNGTNSIPQSSGEPEIIANSSPEQIWRQSLPPTLQNRKTLHKLDICGCTVYLLGTSHISRSSCDDVQQLMSHVQPDGLFLELCPKRLAILMPSPDAFATSEMAKLSLKEIIKQAQIQNPGMTYSNALSSALLTKIQSDYATKLNITVGSEFRQAHGMAISHPKKCRVVLGDRPVQITLMRCWESLSLWGKIKLVIGLVYSQLKQPSDKEMMEWMDSVLSSGDNDVLTKSIQELKDAFPSIARVVIEERDVFMVCKLCQMIGVYNTNNRMETIVAVVGAGHCAGICRLVEEMKRSDQMLAVNDVKYYSQTNLMPATIEQAIIEQRLKAIIETKKQTVENSNDLKLLLTDVIELQHTDEAV
mmetsp:Transcript_9727/g.14065  ORF Transcript_9727/g.14065 Transcript_9727/m.14065 type:complete len:456 (-) Transcript_9727:108-1475(-)|eukprot:CAMPEP_0172422654 /NCGR_PEP_ID=MMETSP1064-20121228/8784_1 /TAXON_ID=202472 /ORGANISM="Aulacoseira subarctica , Strain CCAP 1002/5" /LENGTH=455 /DNA_ID=CAMNT_0013163613 /DNA_START=122 /DNA_END=1489 /DNA_ORIENTATION=-